MSCGKRFITVELALSMIRYRSHIEAATGSHDFEISDLSYIKSITNDRNP